jgi:hypothetical protein
MTQSEYSAIEKDYIVTHYPFFAGQSTIMMMAHLIAQFKVRKNI